MTAVTLTPFTTADIPRLISWIPDGTMLLQWAGPTLHWPLTADQLERDIKAGGPGTSHLMHRVDSADGTAVGNIDIKAIDRIHANAVLARILVAPDHRGRGYALPMVNAALKICFEEMTLHRVGLRVFAHNTGAISTYKRAGFIEEGRDREVRRTPDGVWWDAVTMGILEQEWRKLNNA